MSVIEGAREIADAVLFEGYLLYPYRANDAKNAVRWQFGVLAPPAFVDVDASEHSWLQTECVLEGHDVAVTIIVRFLQVQHRVVERATAGTLTEVESLDVGAATYLPCDEAVVVERDVRVTLPALDEVSTEFEIAAPRGVDTEALVDDGVVVGRLLRTREPLRGGLRIEAEPLPGPYGVRRLRLRLQNLTAFTPHDVGRANRPEALRRAFVAAHLLVEADNGSFVSQLDPSEWARDYVDENEQVGCFPVLAGPPGARDLVLASPIILYDHPQVAPESEVAFFDATEMDEMLTLRTMTLTDEEKRLARGSDPRAAALVDQVDHLPPELLSRLHGTIRGMTGVARTTEPAPQPTLDAPWWDPGQDMSVDPDRDFVVVDDVVVSRGSSVRLRPGGHGTDAQDMFLEGRLATVEAVLFDVDGGTHLAVALNDLLQGGYNPHGRFLYFAPDEVEPVQVDVS
ncbi:MAG TPA: hypothetical protein VK662_15255 [Acidothermaceae bacterium]|nr:hypothetical protein [Acidothermaceae bacterium]